MLKAPIKQTASDTISTLSSRLASATLLEDRRASILGLRSFAKQYPASVASGSLRDLIACLRTNGAALGKEGAEGDVDTVRLVLETLLMLFNPDDSSPEASEDIALWLADEFSQRQDNITILLDLLDTADYYARMYSLQLLTSISASRPERTQECILHAPLGTARLVSTLDDGRDAVRNAALLLLVDLTNVSQTELQKLIAFEDAFARTFKLIQAEGGIGEGGIVVQDCLSLLANLIRHSASNQSLFRESGCVPRLVKLLREAATPVQDENDYSRSNREKNAWGMLAVVRLFLEKGEIGTKASQDSFWRAGMAQLVLDLAFTKLAGPPVRASALTTCASLILSNQPIQEAFAPLQVSKLLPAQSHTNGAKRSAEQARTYVIEALLGLVLDPSSTEALEIRSAACSLIKAYFSGHTRIKHHFLQRAVAGFVDAEAEGVNVLSTFMSGPTASSSTDVPRFIFASDIISQLLTGEAEAKAMLMAVSEGDADRGEDVITAIQTLSGHLLSCLQNDADPRISVAYLTLLITFLFDSASAVNDCLAEGSSLMGALILSASQSSNSLVAADPVKSLIPGLCAALLGTTYEFSTKDSPISRRTLQPFLVSRLGRQRYFDALKQLRQHPIVRDSEVMLEIGPGPTGEFALVDPLFAEWFKDEYGRLQRAIDKDPGIEVLARTDAGVDRDVLDELRAQLASKDEALQQLEQDGLTARQKVDQSEAEHRKELQSIQLSHRSLEAEIDRVKRVNEALQRDHDAEVQQLHNDMSTELERVQNAHRISSQSAQQQHDKEVERLQTLNKASSQSLHQQHEKEVERIKGQHGASLASEKSLWEDKARKATEQTVRDYQDRVNGITASHQTELAEMMASHRSKLEEVTSSLEAHQRGTKVLKEEHHAVKSSLETLREEHAKLTANNEQLGCDLTQTRGLQENLQQVNSKAMSRIKTLEAEHTQKDMRLSTMTEDVERAGAEKDTLTAKLQESQDEIKGLKAELAAERLGYGELETELEKVKQGGSVSDASVGKVSQLEENIKSEREDAQKARTELEDMLMVMSDIEAKRDEYKERLKELGEEVSDDDDDEGDEGEDGDGEDDDGVE